MPSSRFNMRKPSRHASPMVRSKKNSSTPEVDKPVEPKSWLTEDGWVEPPLRPPAPSFEDYKGLERQGVLEHMAPLGTFPSQKVKLRVKLYDPNRRSMLGRNGDGAASTKEPPKAVEPTATKRPESRRADERPQRTEASTREKDRDEDYTPKSTSAKSASIKASASYAATTPPNSKTSEGQARLRQVVESAVERSKQLGNEIVGLAIRRLFEESLHSSTLADLLDAVLTQRPTPRQTLDFQTYIIIARKQIKDESRRSSVVNADSPSKSDTKSPPKSSRPSVNRQLDAASADLAPSTSSDQQHPSPSTNGVPAMRTRSGKEHGAQPPAKRVKRSHSRCSTSSLSSLSSTDPTLELDVPQSSNQTAANGVKSPATTGPKLHNFSTNRVSKRKAPTSTDTVDTASIEGVVAKRRKLKQMDYLNYPVGDSKIRDSPTTPKPLDLDEGSTTVNEPNGHLEASPNLKSRRESDEGLPSSASSAPGDFLIPPPPGKQAKSRLATPTGLGRPKHAGRKGARVKISPMKKKAGVVAGIARSGGARDNSVGKDHAHEHGEIENVDYCSACGGNGQLLCCDGCIRSFHFGCLDPPIDPKHPPEGEWYCSTCLAKRDMQSESGRGVFGGLDSTIKEHNPEAFNLPPNLRDFFDEVKTGDDGEYEEPGITKSKTRGSGGHDESHDNLKLKDGKGTVVLCSKCDKSALGRREIIACDFCTLHWHLDCLDPPLANAPPADRSKHSWMCPAHVDRRGLIYGEEGYCRVHKQRRSNHAKPVNAVMRRGVKNNGMIDIENDPSDNSNESDLDENGVIYHLSEKSIKLDFIDRVKRSRITKPAAKPRPKVKVGKSRDEQVDSGDKKTFNARPFADQEAALNLAKFAGAHLDLGLESDQIQGLINALVMEAPAEVVALANKETVQDGGAEGRDASVPPTPPTSDLQERSSGTPEKQYLLKIQELIRRRLEDLV